MRAVVVCALAYGHASCLPALGLDERATISCAIGGVCPPAMRCADEIALCVPLAPGDGDSPTVVASALSRRVLAVGATTVLTFDTSEPLGAAPAVQLAEGGAFSELAADALSYTFVYTATGAEAEGETRAVIELYDRVANRGVASSEALRFDFTPPRFLSASAPDDHTVRITLSEPLIAEPRLHRCEDVLANVRRALKQPRIPLGEREDCADQIARARSLLAAASQPNSEEIGEQIEHGGVDGVKAVSVAHGPGGSGRYWQIGLALGTKDVACIETSTVGWRNLGSSGIFPPFLVMGRPQRLTIWESINSLPPDDDGADIPPLMLILPVVYRLGRGELVYDVGGTKDELRKWAKLFARSAGDGHEFPAPLHRAAAAAYRAYADGRGCP